MRSPQELPVPWVRRPRLPTLSGSAHQLAPDESAPAGLGRARAAAAAAAAAAAGPRAARGRTDTLAGGYPSLAVCSERIRLRAGPGFRVAGEGGGAISSASGKAAECSPVFRPFEMRRLPELAVGFHGFVWLLGGEPSAQMVSDSLESPIRQIGSTVMTGLISRVSESAGPRF